MLKVYHGSNVPVSNPKIIKSERMLDFGSGFYTTYNHEQAVRWSERVANREKTTACVITEYEFDIKAAQTELQILQFESPDSIWLDFVCANRLGKDALKPYDIAIGPVANDMVYTTILLYEQNVYDVNEAIKRLKVQELYNQVLFHTDEALKYCKYVNHEEIRG